MAANDSSSSALVHMLNPPPKYTAAAKGNGRNSLVRADASGAPAPGPPGKSLGRVYAFVGKKIGNVVNAAAQKSGRGPTPVAEVISAFFKEHEGVSVAELRSKGQIEVDVLTACSRLITLATRSQTPPTQLSAFRHIVTLSTRFPGLSSVFEEKAREYYTSDGRLYSPEDLFHQWERPNHAAFDRRIAPIVDGQPMSVLCSMETQVFGLSYVEHLLNASMYDATSPFTTHLAIRYLANILTPMAFWRRLKFCRPSSAQDYDHMHAGLIERLLRRAVLLLEDLGIDSDSELHSTSPTSGPNSAREGPKGTVWPGDYIGVDAYCAAILLGLRKCLARDRPKRTELAGERWFPQEYYDNEAFRFDTVELFPSSWRLWPGIYRRYFHLKTKEQYILLPPNNNETAGPPGELVPSEEDEEGQVWLLPEQDIERGKVYELVGHHWVDRGTAICYGEYQDDTEQARLIARSERSFADVILSSPIDPMNVYQRQQETLILWTERNGADFALSFQDPQGCSEVWEFICDFQQHMASAEDSQSSPLDSTEPTTADPDPAPGSNRGSTDPVVAT
uniref:PP4R3 EVH1-like domain-containing protein n=1 Tax=Mycena chlorophos TaxID=658473 RepID=A0ABQ0LMM8_MYCCL|nr:predicted protein [Mycena chlorophos]